MKTVYVNFDIAMKGNKDFEKGMVEVIDKYANKIHFVVTAINTNEDLDECDYDLGVKNAINILYRSDDDCDWCANQELLIVDRWSQIDEIVEFYSKYDYVTLEEIK